MKRIGIVGAGISGMAAAYECCRAAPGHVECTVFEAGGRAGGTVHTQKVAVPNVGEFIVELGPDGWVSEKPWAGELATELGLADELVGSNDAERKTYLLRDGALHALPKGMRLMVPTDLDAIRNSDLLSADGKRGYVAEPDRADALRWVAKNEADVSVADFVRRHFGEEATRTFAAPLLAGVFGGDIKKLSARSVMPAYFAMEKEHGSLILALQKLSHNNPHPTHSGIFTALRGGNVSLIQAMERQLPAGWLRLHHPVAQIRRAAGKWRVRCLGESLEFDGLMLATPAHVTAKLLADVDEELSQLHAMAASSGVVCALMFDQAVNLPAGFGFLVEQPQPDFDPAFLACTFSHQKYPHCAPAGGALLRVFFGGANVSQIEQKDDDAIRELATAQLRKLFSPMPDPTTAIVQRWPLSLPQYEVGHEDRVREIEMKLHDFPGLFLLGNGYRGVGLPDMIRLAGERARQAMAS